MALAMGRRLRAEGDTAVAILLSLWVPDDWSKIFLPSTPILEIVVRGSVIYLALFFGLRVLLKRESAEVGISDLLVIVLIADAVQNGMAGQYTAIADALVLAATIIGWDWVLSFLAFRFRSVRVLIRPRPMLLIRDGKLIAENVRKELLTEEEILGQLRAQGVERIEDVKEAYIESSGAITVIPKRQEGERKEEPRARV